MQESNTSFWLQNDKRNYRFFYLFIFFAFGIERLIFNGIFYNTLEYRMLKTFNGQIFGILHSIREYLISNLECSNMNYYYLFIFSLQKLQNLIGNKIFSVVLDINRPQISLWQLFDLLRFWDETRLALGIGSYSLQAVPWDTRGTLFFLPPEAKANLIQSQQMPNSI